MTGMFVEHLLKASMNCDKLQVTTDLRTAQHTHFLTFPVVSPTF